MVNKIPTEANEQIIYDLENITSYYIQTDNKAPKVP